MLHHLSVPRYKCQRSLQSIRRPELLYQFQRDFLKCCQHLPTYRPQAHSDVLRRRLDDILWLRSSHFLKPKLCLPFNSFQKSELVFIIKGHTYTFFSSPSCPTCSVNIRIRVFRRVQLNYQVHLGNIKASSGHISCYQTLEGSLSKSLKSDVPLVLGNVSVQHLSLNVQFGL